MTTLNTSLVIDNTNGENLFFSDISTDEVFADTEQIRLLNGVWSQQQNPETLVAGDELIQWKQYRKTGGITPTVYDDKTIAIGDTFIPFIAGLEVLAGDTFETTGFYSAYIAPADYLPTSSFNILPLSSSYFGYTDSIYPSDVYSQQYEVYGVTSPDPLTDVVEDTQYIVYGTTGTAVADGNTYRIGEVFIAQADGSVTFTGDATLKILVASVYNNYTFIWPLEYRYLQLVLATDFAGYPNSTSIEIINILMQALIYANYQQWVSMSWSVTTIDWIEEQLNILKNANS